MAFNTYSVKIIELVVNALVFGSACIDTTTMEDGKLELAGSSATSIYILELTVI